MKILCKIRLTSLVFLVLVKSIVAQGMLQTLPSIQHLNGNYYTIAWEGVSGRVYFMEVSSQPTSQNDFAWNFCPDIRVGTGTLLGMGFEANAENSEFFRLRYIDYSGTEDPNLADFDGDGFTNLEEAVGNTNPFDAAIFPSSDGSGNSGGGNGNGSGTGEGNSNDIWEYKLTYSVDSVETIYTVNPANPILSLNFALGDNITTALAFEDVIGENQVAFLELEPNKDYDSSDTDSIEYDVRKTVYLSADNPN